MISLIALLLASGTPTPRIGQGPSADGGIPWVITCPDGTCSGGGGGGGGAASVVTVDGGRLGAIDWIDGGFINATVTNFPATQAVSGTVTANAGSGTFAVSGTVTTTPPSNASTNVAQFGGTNVSTGTGTGGAGIPRVTVSSDSSITANAGGGNFNVVGTVTANQGSPNSVINRWPVQLTDGVSQAAVKAASTAAVAADPAQVVAISPNNTVSTQNVDATSSSALGALNAAVTLTTLGTQGSPGIQFPATNTLSGTLVAECSTDKGTTWPASNGFFVLSNGTGALTSIAAASSPTSTSYGILCPRGTNGVRVRVSAFTSGTVTPTLAANFTAGLDPVSIAQSGTGTTFVTPLGGWAIDTGNTKEAYLRTTNASTSDPALVVALSPNSVGSGAAIAGGRGVISSDVIRVQAAAPVTYSCASAAKTAVVANTLPFTSICGSATKAVRVQKVRVSATVATAAIYADLVVKKYSSGPTGGTTTAFTKVPHDSSSSAATATGCVIYTAAPTDGTAVGVIDGTMYFAPVTGTAATFTQPQTLEYFARTDSEAPTLHGTAECLTVNFGTTPTNAPTAHVQWTWTEE